MFDVQVTSGASSERHDPNGDNDPTMRLTALDVHAPTGPSGRAVLDQPVTLVGRHPACDLRFVDEAVAYFQCALVKTRGEIWCVDLLSRSGTAVNGQAARVVPLRNGDLIEIGKVALLLRTGAQPAPPVALFAPGAGRPTGAGNAALNPFQDMMDQFQQCFAAMTRMFTTMQQEHTAMMCEQMRQIQDLLRATREPGAKAPLDAPNVPLLSPPAVNAPAPMPKPPVPKNVGPDEARQLTDAHAWFLDRLGQNGISSTNKPKPN